MNVRKPVDYSAMFAALDTLMTADLPQMELYCEIGRLVSDRPEKGAAVAAAEYLCGAYPDTSGFSPRNLRRMREFYRTYESAPEVLAEAMTIGWTQNVVILEAELTPQERAWYIKAAGQFGWSKLELAGNIRERIHESLALDNTADPCYSNGPINRWRRKNFRGISARSAGCRSPTRTSAAGVMRRISAKPVPASHQRGRQRR